MVSAQINGALRVALAAMIWGAAYPLTKLVLTDVPPILLGFLRFSIAALIFTALTRGKPANQIEAGDRRTFLSLAFWGVFVLILGMNFGLIWAPGIAASVLSGTPPLFTVVLAAIYLGEKMLLRHFVSIAMALTGLAMLSGDLTGPGSELEGWKILIGCLLTLVPQFSWAMYGITGKKLSEKYHWTLICRETFAIGAMMLAIPAAIEVAITGFGKWNLASLLILLYLALMNSLITYSLWNSALKLIPVSTASFLIYLQPVSGAVLSYFLFAEKPGTTGIAGIILIFFALLLVVNRAAPATNVLPQEAV